jgi:DNA-binding phage protein
MSACPTAQLDVELARELVRGGVRPAVVARRLGVSRRTLVRRLSLGRNPSVVASTEVPETAAAAMPSKTEGKR